MTNTVASVIAFLVLIISLFTALGLLAGEKYLWWLITFLALAVVLGWTRLARL